MKDLISIITVNYFSEVEILASLKSIVDNTQAVKFEYIVVSNSPLDPLINEQLLKIHPQSRCIQQSSNTGFASACNEGVRQAKGSHVFLLNPDTRIHQGALQSLHAFTQSHPDSVVGPLTLDDQSNISFTVKSHLSLGFFLSWVFPFFDRVFTTPKFHPYTPYKTKKVDVLNGSALFCSKSTYHRAGGMDSNFFMYWEENDFAEKARLNSIPLYFLRESTIVHKQGTSTKPYFLEMERQKHRSQSQFVTKYYPEYLILNRLSGILAYTWRWVFMKAKRDDQKCAQYSMLLKWYLFEYE